MKKDLWNQSLEKLQALHQRETKNLERSLLKGAAWEELIDQRRKIGELSMIIYKKTNPAQFTHPAESSSRINKNPSPQG